VPALGDFLAIIRFRNELWTAMSAFLLLIGALIIWRLFYWEHLRQKLESTLVLGERRQLGLATILSLVMFVGFIVAHVLNLYVHRVV
jgi:predicted Co/Zn/Cd cation transporter (cation efflux family)